MQTIDNKTHTKEWIENVSKQNRKLLILQLPILNTTNLIS